jgi:hypothetical protein
LDPKEVKIQTGVKVLEPNYEEVDKLIKHHHYTYSSDYAAAIMSLDLYDRKLHPLLTATPLL